MTTSTSIISIPGAEPLAILDARGWTKGSYGGKGGGGSVCLHGAIRLCQPVPGDAPIVEAVARDQGWGPSWNDAPDTDEKMVRAVLAAGIEITDDDLHSTFGPQWEAVVWMARRHAVLTHNEREALDAALNASPYVAWVAARSAARVAARSAFRYGGRFVPLSTVRAAAACAVVWDLASEAGRFTFADRDLLIGPWEAVIGLPPTLDRSTP